MKRLSLMSVMMAACTGEAEQARREVQNSVDEARPALLASPAKVQEVIDELKEIEELDPYEAALLKELRLLNQEFQQASKQPDA